MKRLVIATLVLLMAASASAFDAEKRGGRIALLQVHSPERPGETTVGMYVVRHMRTKLRKAGFEAFTVSETLADVKANPLEDVDYYVELEPWDADSDPYGGVGVDGPFHSVDIALVRSEITAQVRVFDAQTFEEVGSHFLRRGSTALLPASIGVGRGTWHGWLAVPLAQYWQYRRLTRKIGDDAAVKVAEIVRNPA